MNPERISAWITTAAVVASSVWTIVSAIVNVCFRFKTPEEWLQFVERAPRGALVIKVTRAWGVDPLKGLKVIRDYAAAREPKRTLSDRPPPPPPDTLP
jgi:uncharacterized membrane protein YkgB